MSDDEKYDHLEESEKCQMLLDEMESAHDTLTQLATHLGCPIEALTVENLERVFEGMRKYEKWEQANLADGGGIAQQALAPFKRGA